ncbi:RNA polymerase sigma factor [Asticcacaulis sp. W401b]|uniref:RNA polymerase sigma factor n=1 Tax=Asticcacaulis sp. W401b TaxID=3388666 RepID=UPI003970BB97
MADVLEVAPMAAMAARPPVSDARSLNQLLKRVALRDRAALKLIYDQTMPRLYALLLRMVKRRETADDLMQDVFVTVWTKAHQFDAARGSAEVWLFSIARRRAIDRLRISHREALGLEEDIATLEPTYVWLSETVDIETALTVQRCLATLTPDIKKAMQLCYTYGLTHEELAAEMRVPVGTAKTWVRKGLLHLKECLKGYGRN